MRTVVRFLGGAVFMLVAGFASRAMAGDDCGCDHTIEPGTGQVNGTELGFMPGDVVCVMAGDYEYIRFREVKGTSADPIVVKNCGGVVNVHNTDRAYAIDFQGSSHDFHLTGTGDPNEPYGFRVSAPATDPYPGIGLWFLDKSTDYEVDHIEVFDTGFAGVMAKTDPLCDGSADQDVFIQRNVHLHHLWVHDTGGEGFYVGSTQSNGHTITCDGQSEVHQPHFLEGIEIDHVLVEDTGWDGMQVGMARMGCSVHDNVIRRVGGEGVQYQQQGLQIGTYSSCDIRRNTLSDGPVMGVFVLGAYDTTVADNVIARFGEDAVYANLNMTPGPVSYRIVHNTLLGFGGAAVRVFGDQVEGAVGWNNFVVGADNAISAGNDVGWDASGNVFVPNIDAALFSDPTNDDFRIVGDSPARGAGIDHTADGFDVDHDGFLRAVPPAAGAYEHADDSPTSGAGGGGDGGGDLNGGGPAAGGSNGSGGNPSTGGSGGSAVDSDGGGGDDGCSCHTTSGGGGNHAAWLAGLGLVAAARARRGRRAG
ncbi:MAG: hypothetical protein HOW73_11305 [Polyangiaceae bacterium]|nr:hypothetical protein [Polyangiaceae bacterium]